MQLSNTQVRHPDDRLARRNRLVSETIPLAHALAAELLRSHGFSISHEDLKSCGMRGLLYAADSYDDRRGASFSTYAYKRVRGTMLDAIRDGHGQCTRSEMARIQRTRKELGHTRDLAGSEAMTAPHQEQAVPCLRSFRDDWDSQAAEHDDERATPEDLVARRRVASHVRAAIAGLPARARQVVELLYYEHHGSYEAVARQLGMTRPHIFRIHARALRQLRSHLAHLSR